MYVELEMTELTDGGFLYGPIPSSCSAKILIKRRLSTSLFWASCEGSLVLFSFINKSVKANGPKRENCNVYLPPDLDAACQSRWL